MRCHQATAGTLTDGGGGWGLGGGSWWRKVDDVWEVCVNSEREGWSKKRDGEASFNVTPVIQHTSSLPLFVIPSLLPSGISFPLLSSLPLASQYSLSQTGECIFPPRERYCHIYECDGGCSVGFESDKGNRRELKCCDLPLRGLLLLLWIELWLEGSQLS